MFGAPVGSPSGTLPFFSFSPPGSTHNPILEPPPTATTPMPTVYSQQQQQHHQQQQSVFSTESTFRVTAPSLPSAPPMTASSGSVFMGAAPFGSSAAYVPQSPPLRPFAVVQGEPSSVMGGSGGFVPGYSVAHGSPQQSEFLPKAAAAATPMPSLVFGAGVSFPGQAVEVKVKPFSTASSVFSTTAAPSAFFSASKPITTAATTTTTAAAAAMPTAAPQPMAASAFWHGPPSEKAPSQPKLSSAFGSLPQAPPPLKQTPLSPPPPPPPSSSSSSFAPVAITRKRRADDNRSPRAWPMAESNTESLVPHGNLGIAEHPQGKRRPHAKSQHPHQHEHRHQQQKGKDILSFTGKDQLLSVRVFAAFMSKILDNNEARREEATDIMDKAFFGVVGSHGGSDFPTALQQMLSVWLAMKDNQTHVRGEHWVALFAFGCHLNYIASTILSGDPGKDERGQKFIDNRWSALSAACNYANIMCDICLQLFANQSENHVPFGVLPLILRRARNTFELACDEGVSNILPNVKTVLLKLHRYVRVPVLLQEPNSVVDRQRASAFAHVLGEMMLHCCAPAESRLFVESFHEHCASMVETRCTLYHHCAHNLLQEPLTDGVIHQAMELLARALVIVPHSATENRRLLFVKLTACGLALGRLPAADETELEELKDLIVAVRSANLTLFNIAMSNNSELYVRCGIHNVLQGTGKRIALLMVVKYYVVSGMPSRLPLQELIDYYNMPLSPTEVSHVWLLPLLVERRINGVIDRGVLVLSEGNPFDDYTKEKLIVVADAIANGMGTG